MDGLANEDGCYRAGIHEKDKTPEGKVVFGTGPQDPQAEYPLERQNQLRQESGEGYDLYKFAQKLDRLANPPDSWFGCLTGSRTRYGRFLGPGDAGPREFLDVLGPRDHLDFGAQKHDKRYQAASGPTGGGYTAMFNPEVSGADFMLSYDFFTAPLRGRLYDYWYGLGPLILGVGLYPTLGLLKLAPYVEPAL